MTLNKSLKNFYHITCFVLLYFTIFSHPKSIIELTKNPVSISSIPYLVFMSQLFFFLKECANNSFKLNLKSNYKLLLIIIALFLSQTIGLFNAYLNNKSIFNYTSLEATYYLTSVSAYILLLFNNKENYHFLHKANIVQIIIFLLILFTFILNAKQISYGAADVKIKLELLNFEKIYTANSNGLGRISVILALFFLIISISKNKLNYYIFIIATFFAGITFAYEGKFNISILVVLVIYIIYNTNYKNKIFLFIFFLFLSLVIYFSNYHYQKKKILADTKNQISKLNNFKYNTTRIINTNVIGDSEILDLIRTHPNYQYFEYFIENKFTNKINNYSTGRLNKFIYFFLYNKNFILGTGPMSDRAITNINNYKVNNDSASAITYTYLTSGFLGLILLFYFYYYLIKIFFIAKIEKNQFSKIYIKSLILLIFTRALIENSFTVWGIDFCVLLLSIISIKYYSNKVNQNNS